MTKDMIEKIQKQVPNLFTAVFFILIPCISYILFEYVTGNLLTIPIFMAVLNIGWICIFYLLIFAITGTTKITIPVVSILLYILSLAETFVVSFRGQPIMYWDIWALKTALSVSGHYEYIITKEMVIAGVLIVLINLVAFIFPRKVKGIKFKLIWAGASVTAAACYIFWFFGILMPSQQYVINTWDLNTSFQEYGFIGANAISLQYAVKKKPYDYSYEQLKRIENDIKAKDVYLVSNSEVDLEEDITTPVNIICIMNESLTDLKAAGTFETNQEYFPFLNSLEENTIKGNLVMPVFGSMTSNSEFEFLIGDSMVHLPYNISAYQFYVKPETFSLVSTLKDQGYEAVAMHPYPGDNWNRKETYANMGFDEFLDEDYYTDSKLLRNYVSDQGDYEALIKQVEGKKNPTDRLFLFNVTMQNHGGYETMYDDFPQEVWLTGSMEGKYPKADQFLSLMKRSDEAFEYLINYFEASDEPTMIVMFGDHQPSLEDEFYDEIAGMSSDEVPRDKRIMWYETPFIIWTNYETESQTKDKISAFYLGSELLQQAGLEMTSYEKFLLSMEEELPVIHTLGCIDSNNVYYKWSETSNEDFPYTELLRDYEYLVYNHSYDSKKYTELFTIEKEQEE
jgi:phosphoglycerol transferase MdoB-like AlkP superfamily enzyme